MEIRNVVNEVKNEYPKMEQVNKKYLLNSIPKKWQKVGLSSFVITLLMKKYALATIDISTINTDVVAGDEPIHVMGSLFEKICNIACPIVQIVSALMFIVTGLNMLITKRNSKGLSEPRKVKKLIKILFIISIVLFVISTLARIIINNIY